MSTTIAMEQERHFLYSPIGLRLLDELTQQAPLGKTAAAIDARASRTHRDVLMNCPPRLPRFQIVRPETANYNGRAKFRAARRATIARCACAACNRPPFREQDPDNDANDAPHRAKAGKLGDRLPRNRSLLHIREGERASLVGELDDAVNQRKGGAFNAVYDIRSQDKFSAFHTGDGTARDDANAAGFIAMEKGDVTERFKTSHQFALQNQPL